MKMRRDTWKQFGVATTIVLALVAVVVMQPPSSMDVLSALNDGGIPRPAIVSLAQALHDDRPIVIVFVPVERCEDPILRHR